MAVGVAERGNRSLRWSTLFHSKAKSSQEQSKAQELASEVKHAVGNLPREEGVTGAGATEETDPIQNIAGTGISINDPQEPTATKKSGQVYFDGETKKDPSPGGSIRRGSDEEIQTAAPGHLSEEEESGRENNPNDKDDEEVDRIEFYRRDEPYFWLSNGSEHPVYLDGVRYPTAEHLFQSMKFLPNRPEIVSKIRKTNSPTDAIKEARKNMSEVKKGWISAGGNKAAMRDVLLLKFSQHSALKRQLLLTGDSELVEASPTDAFWGSGAGFGMGLGRNELGKALVRTRETIRAQSGLGIGSGAKTV